MGGARKEGRKDAGVVKKHTQHNETRLKIPNTQCVSLSNGCAVYFCFERLPGYLPCPTAAAVVSGQCTGYVHGTTDDNTYEPVVGTIHILRLTLLRTAYTERRMPFQASLTLL
jgi:hypothetical protein